jgi:hypothetical protein
MTYCISNMMKLQSWKTPGVVQSPLDNDIMMHFDWGDEQVQLANEIQASDTADVLAAVHPIQRILIG